MKHRFLFILSLLFFVACTEQTDTDTQNIKTTRVSDRPILETADSMYDDKPAIPPVVIRSALPPGFYGYQPDTMQVSQYIRRIFQDSQGNLWFGTVGDGVCRYDGMTLTYFTTLDGLGGNSVQDIAEDKNGNLWFGTNGGATKFDGKTLSNFTEDSGLRSRHVSSLLIDRSKNIWIGTPEGVCLYNASSSLNKGKEIFTPFPIPESGEKQEVRNIYEDKNGALWFATHGAGVYRSYGGALNHISEKEGLGKNCVRCILQDRNGIMWFATKGGGLCRYDPSAEFRNGSSALINYTDEKGSNEVESVFEDKAGYIWISVRGAVRRYDPSKMLATSGKSFIAYTDADGLNNCCVQSIYEDKAGNLWLGSGAGLFRFDKRRTNHPCLKNKCNHRLNIEQERKEHQSELAKTIVNVTKRGPWPFYFR